MQRKVLVFGIGTVLFAALLVSIGVLSAQEYRTIARVSVSSSGEQAYGSGSSTLSADGRFVTFMSYARLVSDDKNNAYDIFVHDRQMGQTTLVSVSSNGEQANGYSYNGSISADGQWIAFASEANNLVNGDTNNAWDIFVHDRHTAQTTRVSVSSNGSQANGYSYNPSIASTDGRLIAFWSAAMIARLNRLPV